MQMNKINRPVVIGGMVMDLRGRPEHILQLYTSNPGSLHQAPGGVGRNIAENLLRLGLDPLLISAVGDDLTGDALLLHAEQIGLTCEGIVRLKDRRTAVYLAILNEMGDLHTAIADMSIFDRLTPEQVFAYETQIIQAPLVVLDTNLPVATLRAVLELCWKHQRPVWVEPVSVEKARKLARLLHLVTYISPNSDELVALADVASTDANLEEMERVPPADCSALSDSSKKHYGSECSSTPTGVQLNKAVQCLLNAGVANIVLTVGKDGAILGNCAGVQHCPAFPAQVVDVTGAGDSFVAGMVCGLLQEFPIEQAMRYGLAVAKWTVETGETVSTELSREIIEEFLRRC